MRRFGFLSFVFVFLLTTSGCNVFGNPPEKPAEEIVKTAFKNFYNYSSFEYDAMLSAGFDSYDDKKTLLYFLIEGEYEWGIDKPVFTVEFEGSGSIDDGARQVVSGEVRAKSPLIYFYVDEISDFSGGLSDEVIDSFVDKWWRLPWMGESENAGRFRFGDVKGLTDEQKQIRELIEETSFIKDLKYIGNSFSDYKYHGVFDGGAFKEFLIGVGEIIKQEITPEQAGRAIPLFDLIDVTFEIWVDRDDLVLSRLKGNLVLDEGGMSASVVFDVSFDDFGKKVEIEEPEGVENFNLMEFFRQTNMMGS